MLAVGSNSGDGVRHYPKLGQLGEAVFVVYVNDEDAAPVPRGNANVEVRVLLPPRLYLTGIACVASVQPFAVAGRLSRTRHGKTDMPLRANARADDSMARLYSAASGPRNGISSS
jgi:hypothetical protein